ncbi:hypothetical protein DFJ73DRAFT_758048 [Zopfochytrium polystomum]|nr:hypothetical protein DFJ73DRAFT_758048 [Zopfochytrium polystomum]
MISWSSEKGSAAAAAAAAATEARSDRSESQLASDFLADNALPPVVEDRREEDGRSNEIAPLASKTNDGAEVRDTRSDHSSDIMDDDEDSASGFGPLLRRSAGGGCAETDVEAVGPESGVENFEYWEVEFDTPTNLTGWSLDRGGSLSNESEVLVATLSTEERRKRLRPPSLELPCERSDEVARFV